MMETSAQYGTLEPGGREVVYARHLSYAGRSNRRYFKMITFPMAATMIPAITYTLFNVYFTVFK
jgi:hypothetical protein